MAVRIPNLWPIKQVQVDVLTPLAILRTQAKNLNQLTQDILVGKVSTVSSEKMVMHHFDIVVPALQHYTHRLLSVTHETDLAYPATIESQYCDEFGNPDECEAYTQDEFVRLLGKVLESSSVISILQSLIARSNEMSGRFEVGTDEEELMDQEGDAG